MVGEGLLIREGFGIFETKEARSLQQGCSLAPHPVWSLLFHMLLWERLSSFLTAVVGYLEIQSYLSLRQLVTLHLQLGGREERILVLCFQSPL